MTESTAPPARSSVSRAAFLALTRCCEGASCAMDAAAPQRVSGGTGWAMPAWAPAVHVSIVVDDDPPLTAVSREALADVGARRAVRRPRRPSGSSSVHSSRLSSWICTCRGWMGPRCSSSCGGGRPHRRAAGDSPDHHCRRPAPAAAAVCGARSAARGLHRLRARRCRRWCTRRSQHAPPVVHARLAGNGWNSVRGPSLVPSSCAADTADTTAWGGQRSPCAPPVGERAPHPAPHSLAMAGSVGAEVGGTIPRELSTAWIVVIVVCRHDCPSLLSVCPSK